ncbi:MAG: hypothetical protein BJ554DRAFT_6230, partial [Olpidium bornovanus]
MGLIGFVIPVESMGLTASLGSAPQLASDFYLNLLDWSSRNILAVALFREVYLWNGSTGTVSLFSSQYAAVSSISFSPDGLYLAIATEAGSIQVWLLSEADVEAAPKPPEKPEVSDEGAATDLEDLFSAPDPAGSTASLLPSDGSHRSPSESPSKEGRKRSRRRRRRRSLVFRTDYASRVAVMAWTTVIFDHPCAAGLGCGGKKRVTYDLVAGTRDGFLIYSPGFPSLSAPMPRRPSSSRLPAAGTVVVAAPCSTCGSAADAPRPGGSPSDPSRRRRPSSPLSKFQPTGYLLSSPHTAEVCGLRFSAEGKQFATGGNDNAVCVWETRVLAATVRKFTASRMADVAAAAMLASTTAAAAGEEEETAPSPAALEETGPTPAGAGEEDALL